MSDTEPFLAQSREASSSEDLAASMLPSHVESDTHGLRSPRRASGRIPTVDIARGITIALMIFVNHAGDRPKWIQHVKWNGLHLADLVMPAFLYICGTSIALSLVPLKERLVPRKELMSKVGTRCLKLFGLGLLTQGGSSVGKFPYFDLSTLRVMGVLQRISLCVAVVSAVVILMPRLSLARPASGSRSSSKRGLLSRLLAPVLAYPLWWLMGIAIFVTFSLLLLLLHAPRCHEPLPNIMPDCNVAGHFDRAILGEDHMFSHPTCQSFKSHPCYFMDPEGLFTSSGATVSVFLGLYTGILLLMLPSHGDRLISLGAQFCGCLSLTLFLGLFVRVPINKNLYTPSYIMATGAVSALLVLCIYIPLEVWQSRRFTWAMQPFVWLGMNSITVFVGDELLSQMLPWVFWGKTEYNLRRLFLEALMGIAFLPKEAARNALAALDSCFWTAVAGWLHQRKIFFKV